MKVTLLKLVATAGLCLAPALSWAGERKQADIDCNPTDEALVYVCTIALRDAKSGAPIKGAEFMVGADMPSMPAAHNVKPVAAEPSDEAGKYRAKLHLEMMGEWALKLDFTKPGRDRVVKKLHFGGPAGGDAPNAHQHDHHKHRH